MLARIITGQAEGVEKVSAQLRAAGYEVEVAAPGAEHEVAADLEIELDRMPVAQALQAARACAEILVAPGVVEAPKPEPEVRVVPEVEEAASTPPTPEVRVPEVAPQAAEAAEPAPVAEVRPAAAPPPSAAIKPKAPAPRHASTARVARPHIPPRRMARPVKVVRRRMPRRDVHWQRAVIVASMIVLAAILVLAALKIKPTSPLPAELIQNKAQQDVPFGPAKMPPPAAMPPAAAPQPAAAAPETKAGQKPKPSAAHPSPAQSQGKQDQP